MRISHRGRPWLRILLTLALLSVALLGASRTAVAGPGAEGSRQQVPRPAATSPGSEPYRPRIHYTPAQNWMNDPNGLIFYKGRYHLFYQYNPSGNTWGNMSWGHAVSTDLVHWKELPLAIPQDDQEMVFSGSVVLDRNNTSGLGTSRKPPLVAVYTSNYKQTGKQAQSLAYSTDEGLTWTKYSGNPVLDIGSTNFRDPKVFWQQATHRWLMVVALSDQHKVRFYSSPDLKSWTALSDFGPAGATGGLWECPDLFELPVAGAGHRHKWVLVVNINPGGIAGGSGAQYFTGDFDGTRFTSDDPPSYTPPAGMILADFEGGYGPWTTTGTAFGTAPADGSLPDQQGVSGFVGAGLANSFLDHDASTGTLTSPEFTVGKPYLNFLVGGGKHPHVNGTGDGAPPPGDVLADFEGSTWGDGWTATGSFVNAGPAPGPLPGQIGGRALDTCVESCDPATGTITSPTFTITRRYIDFLIAGGDHPYGRDGAAAFNLVVDGKVVRTATGLDSSDMLWTSWDVNDLIGEQATVQVVDDAVGGWGHLMLDHIVFSDVAAKPRDAQTSVNLLVDGKVVRTATGQNSESLDWASWKLADLAGKKARIQIVDADQGSWGHILADQFTLADAPARSSVERAHWVDYGADFYAAATYNDAPGGQRIMVAWMNNWDYGQNTPTSPWRSADSLPRRLSLRSVDGNLRLVSEPVDLSGLRRGTPLHIKNRAVPRTTVPLGDRGAVSEIDAVLNPGSATTFGLDLRSGEGHKTRLGYDTKTGELYIDRTESGDTSFHPVFPGVHRAPLALDHGKLRLHVVIDASSIEVYANGGLVTLTDQVFPGPGDTGISAFAVAGTAHVTQLTAWRLDL
ncbi:GH32 C-terminal domain-containing protein [Streptomyces sp. NBC_00433]